MQLYKSEYKGEYKMVKEIIFIIEESVDGGYEARAMGHSIFTEGETYDEVKGNIKEAV